MVDKYRMHIDQAAGNYFSKVLYMVVLQLV